MGIAAILLATLPAVAARADDWSTLGLDAARTRLSAERSGTRFADGRWSFTPATPARALASPVVADGYAVSAAVDGTVSVLRAESGQLVWSAAVGFAAQGTPAIAHGRLFVPTLGNKVVAFGLADGTRLWTVDVGGMTLSSPAPVGSDIVFAAGFPQHRLVRLDGATGAVVWQSPPVIDQPGNSSPAVGGGLVVVGSNGGHYYAFDAATGAARWDYQASGVVHLASPLIAGGRVYMAGGNDSDQVHAVDAATGIPISGWPVSLPAPAPDVPGTPMDRHRAVSSFVAVGANLVIDTRLDDMIDTDGDGEADQYLSRETVVALDAGSGTVAWQQPLGRRVFTDPNDVPAYFVCPTPAAFGSAGGALLVAASSLAAEVSVLDAASGVDQGDLPVAGRALASPVMANGRIITVAESNVVEGQLSSVNHPPTAPVLAAYPRPLDAADVTLRWAAALDPDGEQPTYELRIDSDGELLKNFAQQIFPAQGATSVAISAPFSPGVTYTFAVRARDPHGALSPWSAPETFTVATAGAVTVNGVPAANLRSAVAGALAGDLVLLGPGSYPLSDTLQVAGGVSVRGAGAGRTTIDATGLAVGVSFLATDPKSAAGLDRTTVTGAATCVAVSAGATGVQLTHLVVHGCATAGIAVASGGGAAIVNATVVQNGEGVDSSGAATIKNSLLTGNDVGLKSEGDGALTSGYDDLFGNTTPYLGLTAGRGDLASAVAFVDLAGHNLLLSGPQPSTDQGDPADDVGEEPTPNGARINLGAFGGTADAELSAPAAVVGDPATPTPTPATPTPAGPAQTETHEEGGAGGCSVGGRRSASELSTMIFLLAVVLAARARKRRPATRR
ncbi:MAG TPA: PQQ-binding-like beta-propeller repeat protein [Polyangia bacterium]|nr:PQQ-binding-like beta-propeller repeat protein [Polyangia bacterium]